MISRRLRRVYRPRKDCLRQADMLDLAMNVTDTSRLGCQAAETSPVSSRFR